MNENKRYFRRLQSGLGGNVTEQGITAAKDETGVEWASDVASVLGLQEEGVFRTIVGYL